MEKEVLKRLHSLYNRSPDGAWDMGFNAAVKLAIKIVGEESAHGVQAEGLTSEQILDRYENNVIAMQERRRNHRR